ncbi:hypothetical protein R4Z09_06745 [Niallia oryzisoli]|uniref:Uncharacterized protein n=1 Tax=Niallia oryzisoli TaxID=1737571 RepID=A0ABZ2CFW1_9BACI
MEILFDNPFIVIILIAVIFSLFKNKKKAAQDQKRNMGYPTAKKPVRSSSPFDEMKDIFKEVTRTLSEESQTPMKKNEEMHREKNENEAHPLKDTFKQKNVVTENNKGITTGTPHVPAPQSISMEKKENGMKIDESTLVDAVVWAEILGPPRAKNPYQKRKPGS